MKHSKSMINFHTIKWAVYFCINAPPFVLSTLDFTMFACPIGYSGTSLALGDCVNLMGVFLHQKSYLGSHILIILFFATAIVFFMSKIP